MRRPQAASLRDPRRRRSRSRRRSLVAGRHRPSGQAPQPAAAARAAAAESARPLRLLFLGHDRDHHPSGKLLPLLAAPLARRGIQMTHVSTPEEALVASTLKHYDGLVIYANHKTITPEQEQALVDFVEGGKAIVAHPLRLVHVHQGAALHPDRRRPVPAPRHRRVHAPRSSRPIIR